MGYDETLDWQARNVAWWVEITLHKSLGATLVLRAGETWGEFEGVPYAGLVAQWDRTYTGLGSIVAPRYASSRARVTLFNDVTLDQVPGLFSPGTGHPTGKLFDLLNTYSISGSLFKIYEGIPGQGAVLVFTGVVDSVPESSVSSITLDADAENQTTTEASETAKVEEWAHTRTMDKDRMLTVAAGPVGFTLAQWAQGRAPVTNVDEAAFARQCILRAGAPAPLVDKRATAAIYPKCKPSVGASWKPNDSLYTDGCPRVFALWPTDGPVRGSGSSQLLIGRTDYRLPAHVEKVTDSEMNDTEIELPIVYSSTYTTWSGYADKWRYITLRKYHTPYGPDEGDVTNTNDVLTDWQSAINLDDDDAAATFESKLDTFSLNGGFLIGQEPHGKQRAVIPDSSDGAAHYVTALVLYDGTSTVSSAFTLGAEHTNGGGGTQTETFDLQEGYNLLEMELTDSMIAGCLRVAAWGTGTEADERIYCNLENVTITENEVHLIRFGMSIEWPTRSEVMRESTEDAPVKLFGCGYATNDTAAGDVAEAALTLAMASAPIAPVFNTTASTAFGSFKTLTTDLDAGVATATGSDFTTFELGVVDAIDRLEVELAKQVRGRQARFDAQGVVDRIQASTHSLIWKSPATGSWNARAISSGMTADWDVLTTDRVKDIPSMRWRLSDPGVEIKNAVYVNFDYSDAFGKFMGQVFIDNTTIGSRDYQGAPDTDLEDLADLSQDRHGRRAHTIEAPHCRDRASAWSLAYRVFNLLQWERLHLTFLAGWWAHGLEAGSVFTTDTTFNDLMPFPVRGSYTSWTGRKFLVRRVTSQALQPYLIEAVQID